MRNPKPEPSVKDFRSIRDYIRAQVEQTVVGKERTSCFIQRGNEDGYNGVRIVMDFAPVGYHDGCYVEFHGNALRMMIPLQWREFKQASQYVEIADIMRAYRGRVIPL